MAMECERNKSRNLLTGVEFGTVINSSMKRFIYAYPSKDISNIPPHDHNYTELNAKLVYLDAWLSKYYVAFQVVMYTVIKINFYSVHIKQSECRLIDNSQDICENGNSTYNRLK